MLSQNCTSLHEISTRGKKGNILGKRNRVMQDNNRVSMGNVLRNLPRLRRSHVQKGVLLLGDAKRFFFCDKRKKKYKKEK